MFHCLNIISLYIFEGVKRALVYQKDCQTRIEEAKLQNEKLKLNCNHKGTPNLVLLERESLQIFLITF